MPLLEPEIYRWGLVPRAGRFPKRRRHWLRPALAGAVVVGLIGGALGPLPWLSARVSCRPGLLPGDDVWAQDDECVGLSDGGYAFGVEGFDPVLAAVADLNERAGDDPCGNGVEPVTVGVVVTMTSVQTGGRARHELEGFVAAQQAGNSAGCVRPIRLRIGQIGADEQAAVEVATRLAGQEDVVGLVGMGLSHPQSAAAADAVAASARPVPMVADLITAEGFDQNGSRADRPDFTYCAASKSHYVDGIGRDYFYRTAFRGHVQALQQARFIRAAGHRRVDLILTSIDRSDPSRCTELAEAEKLHGTDVTVKFDSEDSTTVNLAVERLCRDEGDVVVVHAARGRDLPVLLNAIDAAKQNNSCSPRSVTVVKSSDASRIRAVDDDPALEFQRQKALRSASLNSGYVRLFMTPLADRDSLERQSPTFATLLGAFAALDLPAEDLDDGWAITAYDALNAMSHALSLLPIRDGDQPHRVTPAQVTSALGRGEVPDAVQKPLGFDSAGGNRTGPAPTVVRVCARSGEPIRTFTVPVLADDLPYDRAAARRSCAALASN